MCVCMYVYIYIIIYVLTLYDKCFFIKGLLGKISGGELPNVISKGKTSCYLVVNVNMRREKILARYPMA